MEICSLTIEEFAKAVSLSIGLGIAYGYLAIFCFKAFIRGLVWVGHSILDRMETR